MLKKRPFILGVLLLLASFHFVTSLRGMDYGRHWDEWYAKHIAKQEIANLSVLPSSYYYGGLYFVPGRIVVALSDPSGFRKAFRAVCRNANLVFQPGLSADLLAWQKRATEFVDSNVFLLRTRLIFSLFSLLGIFVVYFLGKVVRGKPQDGLIAAGLMALSWEVNYHSRHIAIDNLFMVLCATVLLMLQNSWRSKDPHMARKWLFAAAAAAGLAACTKFNAIALIVPCWLAVWLRKRKSGSRPVRECALLFCTALLVLYVVTPGVALDWLRLASDWTVGGRDYSRGPSDYPHYIGSWFVHFPSILFYAFTAFSPYWLPAVFFAAFAGLGAHVLFKKDRSAFYLLISYPLLHACVVGLSRLFIVRNYLPILPATAVLIAVGISAAWERWGRRAEVWVPAAVGAALFITLNTHHMWWTSGTVKRDLTEERNLRDVYSYIEQRPSKRFLLAPQLAENLAKLGSRNLHNTVLKQNERPDFYLAYFSELPPLRYRTAFFGGILRTFGSQEVNYRYYPNWFGNHEKIRIYLFSPSYAKTIRFGEK